MSETVCSPSMTVLASTPLAGLPRCVTNTAHSLFDSIDRINDPAYIPTSQDLLRIRIRSAGVEKAEFLFKDTIFKYGLVVMPRAHVLFIRVYDVGGQIPERRKWAKLLRICTAIIFFASLSEYDQRYANPPVVESLSHLGPACERMRPSFVWKTHSPCGRRF
jgi:hypothetical protein